MRPFAIALSPPSVAAGSTLTILGGNFGLVQGDITVTLSPGSVDCPISVFAALHIECTVPGTLTPGTYAVTVTRAVDGTKRQGVAEYGSSDPLSLDVEAHTGVILKSRIN